MCGARDQEGWGMMDEKLHRMKAESAAWSLLLSGVVHYVKDSVFTLKAKDSLEAF